LNACNSRVTNINPQFVSGFYVYRAQRKDWSKNNAIKIPVKSSDKINQKLLGRESKSWISLHNVTKSPGG